ncbi:MAG: hypothetical protein BGP06_12250 [Rhizobiales bacterium 65-9]|nr:alpha/beta fold hydrolase [Hyphomicrobiales bacterium]OJY37176.1 MAG: hypothetical protein BGP06_12250 [Rhizobiales bacterium 65-9]
MVKRRRLLGLLIATLLTGAVPPAASRDLCPAEQGCKVAEGRYRLIVPPAYSEGAALGAIIFFHGYQGSAEETASDPALLAAAARLGVALVAPDGQGRTWSYPGSPGRYRDEFAFVAHVLDDVSARFPVDPKRIMASGFSQGGSMVWYLACLMPERFRAFAPIAGAFWEPLPSSCAHPRPPLIHVHGLADATVPLAGRRLPSGYEQGDTFESFAILDPAARRIRPSIAASGDRDLSCHSLTANPQAPVLELCLHAGGHVIEAAWIERAWRHMMEDHVSVKP